MLALCSMLYPTYYAKNYAGIMGAGLLMIRMNALQLDLLQLVPTDWTDYRTEYYIIVANYIAVRYFV